MNTHEDFMRIAIELAEKGMTNNEGWPFGCVIVKNGEIIGKWNNRVTSTNDPTAHAEIVAIRDACKNLSSFQLYECLVYTSCEPCPMCLGALYRARPDKVYYACTKQDAQAIDFDDHFIYEEIEKPYEQRSIPMLPLLRDEGRKVFQAWKDKQDKIEY